MRSIFTFALVGLLLVGCQTQTDRQSPTSTTLKQPVLPTKAQPGGPAMGNGAAFDTDDCAARMHTLEGQLILYWMKNLKLPAQLSELQGYVDFGEDVPTVCPVSRQPYIYNPVGMLLGTDPSRLIAYDATPAHAGTRWGIVFRPTEGRSKPMGMNVIHIPEPAMASYRPAPPLPSGQAADASPQTQQAPQSLDQLSPQLREKVMEQQHLLKQELEQRRLQNAPNAQPADAPQQQQPQQPGGNPQQ